MLAGQNQAFHSRGCSRAGDLVRIKVGRIEE